MACSSLELEVREEDVVMGFGIHLKTHCVTDESLVCIWTPEAWVLFASASWCWLRPYLGA